MITVLLVDDQPLLRTGFRMILDAEDDLVVVGEAGDGAEAIRLADQHRPDVIVMDIRMPVMDGVTATARITARTSARVLILTTFHLDDLVMSAIRAGASGFLLKDAPAEQLIAGIRIVAAGDAVVAPAVTRRLLEQFARTPTPPPADAAASTLPGLTVRETDVLRLLARGLSNQQIAGQLVVTETTVKTHVHHLLTKLDLRDRVQLAVLAYDTGLVQPRPT